ncbi:MAG: hypothetical protein ACE5OP_06955 [Candidatus Glassbacteria bacterium]
MNGFIDRLIRYKMLVAMVPILFFLPISPGCFCIEDTILEPAASITREYEGFMIIADTSESILFTIEGSFEREEKEATGNLNIPATTPGDTTETYQLEDISISGNTLTFSVFIPHISTVPLKFETTFDLNFLAGTFELTGGLDMGRLVSVNVEGMALTQSDMVGAYELVTSSTNGDTLTTEYIDELSVRLEFERDGTYRAVSRVLPAGGEIEQTGYYSVTDNLLFINPDDYGFGNPLPISMKGFLVNKDLVIISAPRPFPSFDALVPIEDGIQVEHFKQVI